MFRNRFVPAAIGVTLIAAGARAQEFTPTAKSRLEATDTPTAYGSTSELSLGLRLGGTASTIHSNNAPPLNTRVGFMAGANVDVPVLSHLSLQPELDYIQGGVGLPTNNPTVSASLNLNYLTLPVLLKATLPTGTLFRPFLAAGPSASVLVNKTATFNEPGRTVIYDGDQIHVKSFDFGLNFGAGAFVNLARGVDLVLDARYYLGLMDVNDDGSGSTLHNRGFQFLSGLQYQM